MEKENKHPDAGVIETPAEDLENAGKNQKPDVLESLFGTVGVDADAPGQEVPLDDTAQKPAGGTADEKPEDKGTSEKTTPAAEATPEAPYAKIGARQFKTKEELVEYTNSQRGYNSLMTGALKKSNPEVFNPDGTVNNAKLSELGSKTAKKVEDAAQTVAEMAAKPAAEMTKDDKDELEKARAILRPLGVLFADDPVVQRMRESIEKEDVTTAKQAETVVETFIASHPLIDEHRVDLAEYMERNNLTDLEKGWKGYKALNDIEEQTIIKPDGDKPVNKSVDNNIPVVVKKSSGNTPAPSSGNKDFMDNLVGLKGFR